MNYLKIFIQYLLPQHFLSYLVGKSTHCRFKWLKSWQIHTFIKRYRVVMEEAIESNPDHYSNFHNFFIRHLKPTVRPINQEKHAIISPVDGCISQLGKIEKDRLLQAKKFYFDLNTLLGNQTDLSQHFENGEFCTAYLAPRDYHRVHMPLTGTLRKMIYIPGKLFSVNPLTTRVVPNLFARNERVVCYFETEYGPMAVIMVGAFLVGSMSTSWAGTIVSTKRNAVQVYTYPQATAVDAITLSRGEEMGYFSLGSTVIMLFAPNMMKWATHLHSHQSLRMGESIGTLTDTLHGVTQPVE